MTSLFLQYSIPELIEQLKTKKVVYKDLARTTSDAIKIYEKNTHAWVSYDIEALESVARERDIRFAKETSLEMGILEGMPFGVKDIFNTKQFPTEMGSPIWKNFTPGNNARVVDSVLFSGGLVAGKTVTAEFAVHALNQTLNPHDISRTPGTSSSGSAAAVARGMVPFALATQTAGSIVRPASFCGIWGMKPSFGIIPRTGVLKTSDSLDTIGFVAAHGMSLRPILDATRVRGPNYPFVYQNVDKRGPYPKVERSPWRVGFVKTHTWKNAKPYVQNAIEALTRQIDAENGFVVEEVEWPNILHVAHEVHSTIYTKSLAYYFQQEKKMSSDITPMMAQMMAEGEVIEPAVFQKALQTQVAIAEMIDELFERYDFIVSVGTSSVAPLREQQELPDPSLIWTLAHLPVVAVPAFRNAKGLPFGIQCVARHRHDYTLLQGVETLIARGIFLPNSQVIEAEHQSSVKECT